MTQAPDQATEPVAEAAGRAIHIPQAVMVKDLAGLLDVTPIDVIKELMKNGVMATINQVVDFDTAAIIAADLGFSPEEESRAALAAAEPGGDEAEPASISMRVIEEGEDLEPRPAVVTVLGHVDHGKTTLLDSIRQTKVVEGEAGGITQHVGAYQAQTPDSRLLTFVDTPGHEAFTQMRMRGAQVTDVAIIVVAADDGVMPQTREAIDHVRAAGVPLVVALNKVDLPNADPGRLKQQLMEIGLVPEEFGGDTIVVPVSALQGEGIDDLLEHVTLVADLLELKANPRRPAVAVVLEASTDRHRGVVATLLVQTGTLHMGDALIAGLAYGRVKAMEDSAGNRIKEAGPSTPVVVLGLSEVPPAGERVTTMKNEREARREAETRRREQDASGDRRQAVTLDTLFGEIHRGTVQDFNVVVKTDMQGSIDPLVHSLGQLSLEEVNVKVIHAAAGSINESDVQLAVASKGVIIGFNTQPEPGARRLADAEHVEIREYDVIYQIMEDVEQAVQGLLEPVYGERDDARLEVRRVFRIGRRNAIAGAYVRDGTIRRDSLTRVYRSGEMLHESRVSSLRRFDDDAREVGSGFECGVQVDGFVDFEEGDEIVAYHMERVR